MLKNEMQCSENMFVEMYLYYPTPRSARFDAVARPLLVLLAVVPAYHNPFTAIFHRANKENHRDVTRSLCQRGK